MTAEQQSRVLVVDDDVVVRDLLCAVLRGRGLTVDAADDGRDALELIASRPYGVVVLDLRLPIVDGFTVAARAAERTPRPVVIVVTGADRAAVESLDASSIHGIVRKPFDPDELATVVAACADIRGRMLLDAMTWAMVACGPLLALLSGLAM